MSEPTISEGIVFQTERTISQRWAIKGIVGGKKRVVLRSETSRLDQVRSSRPVDHDTEFGFLLHIFLEAISKVQDSKIKINFKIYKSHWKLIEEFTLRDVEGQKLEDTIGGYCKNSERYKGVLGQHGQWLQYRCILNEK